MKLLGFSDKDIRISITNIFKKKMARCVIRQYPLHSTELKKCFLLTFIHGVFFFFFMCACVGLQLWVYTCFILDSGKSWSLNLGHFPSGNICVSFSQHITDLSSTSLFSFHKVLVQVLTVRTPFMGT